MKKKMALSHLKVAGFVTRRDSRWPVGEAGFRDEVCRRDPYPHALRGVLNDTHRSVRNCINSQPKSNQENTLKNPQS
jgi:hypothetical protein